MSFSWPWALAGLVAIPAGVGLYLLAERRRRGESARFASPGLLPNLVPSAPGWRRHVPPALALAALALLIVGVARPHRVQDVERDEATVVLAIDTSRSMAAQDVLPSRLEAARAAADAFLERVPDSYRVAIVSFSNTAEAVLPPTTDREAARIALRELRVGSGTALGDAVTRSVEIALGRDAQQQSPSTPPPSGERSPAAVLVLSDGEQTAEGVQPAAAAQRARLLGVPVSTVALGTSEAVVEVPLPGGLMERVTVVPDLPTLRRVAQATGGEFYEAPDAERLAQVYEELGTRLAHDRKSVEVTSAFAAGGGLVLLLGSALSALWFRWPL